MAVAAEAGACGRGGGEDARRAGVQGGQGGSSYPFDIQRVDPGDAWLVPLLAVHDGVGNLRWSVLVVRDHLVEFGAHRGHVFSGVCASTCTHAHSR